MYLSNHLNKLLSPQISFTLPYADFLISDININKEWLRELNLNANDYQLSELDTDMIFRINMTCENYSHLQTFQNSMWVNKGWVFTNTLERYIDLSVYGNDEFSLLYKKAAEDAVASVLASGFAVARAACNLCTQAAFYDLTGKKYLYPTSSGGKVNGDGRANSIILELENDEGNLKDYFERIDKNSSETYPQFWERIQNMVDLNKEVIIGTCPGHVFMLVPGGLYEVVNNISYSSGSIVNVEQGDKYGYSFASHNINYVPRIMDCGAGVKYADGPLYGVMDARSAMHEYRDDGSFHPIHFYKYIKE